MTKIKTTTVREKDQKDEQIFLVPKQDEYENDEEEGEEQEVSQARLLSDMMKITKKGAVHPAVRTSLSTSAMDTSHLITSLGPSSSLKKARQSHSLPLTLEKTVAKRIKRAAGYENVAMEANKWAKVVKMRREAEQLHFPLQDASLQLKTVEKVEPLQMKQPLEKEVYALLQGAKLIQDKKMTEEEEAVRKALSLQEIRERNRELWRQKEMKRRYEQKARLMNKSKSRKHHRLLRRERLRKQRAELEELQKTDSEAALERLRELEQARIEERMSLRHKTSKWAHLQGYRATRDKAAMSALQENQRMHRELTTKTARPVDTDDDDDSEDDVQEGKGPAADPSNPWTKNLVGTAKEKGGSPGEESFTRFKKFWEEVNQRKETDQKIQEEMEKKDLEEDKREKDNDMEEGEGNEDEEEKEKEAEGSEGDEEEEEEEGSENEKDDKKVKGKTEEEKESKADEKSHESPEKPTKTPTTEKKKSESNEIGDTESNSRKRKRSKKKRDTTQSLSNEPVSIDELLDEAEMKIKNKIQKKLKKLGMKSNESWKEVKTKKPKKKFSKADPSASITEMEFDFTSTHNQENTDERQNRAKTLEDFESLEGESRDKLQEALHTLRKDSEVSAPTSAHPTKHPKEPKHQLNPNEFTQVEAKWLTTTLPDSIGETGEALDDEERTEERAEDVFGEAFADDYLMEEFSSEKAEAIKKEQAGSMSLALPGWGDWTGPSIKMSNTKVKKFRLRVQHAPRKDSRMGHVLYNERADVHTNLRKAMVDDLPYPFNSVRDFEASVRAPVGRLFMPEAVHKKLIAPGTVTKIGKVIEPMTEDELLHYEKEVKGEGKGERKHNQRAGGDNKRKVTSDTASHKGQKRKALKAKGKHL